MKNEINTFTIGAYDRKTGCFGIATASKYLAVGSVVPHAWADTGLVITQSYGYTLHAEIGRKLLEKGKKPADCIAELTEIDSKKDIRQFALIDRQGDTAAYTGTKCTGWAGHMQSKGVVCIGNMLTGEKVIEDMMDSYLHNEDLPIWERLLEALKAGERAGGDKRGRHAAALLVVRKGGGFDGYSDRVVDLRVDDSKNPLSDLARMLFLWTSEYHK